MMTTTPPDIFAGNSTTPLRRVRVFTQVRCTGRDGNPCGRLLARVDVDRWEDDMASEAKLKCKCGREYSLAEYR